MFYGRVAVLAVALIVSKLNQITKNHTDYLSFALFERHLSRIRPVKAVKTEFVLRPHKIIMALFVLVILSACETGGTVSRSSSVAVIDLPSMRVVGLTVIVPPTLKESEENSIKPQADIVWHGDPLGDRYVQVHDVVDAGLSRGAAGIQGDLPVVVTAEITRFHALTERTRYSIGGVHEIEFNLTISNSHTGEVVVPTYHVDASFAAYGGDRAIAAEREGRTQKVRITQHLAEVIKQEITGIPAVHEE